MLVGVSLSCAVDVVLTRRFIRRPVDPRVSLVVSGLFILSATLMHATTAAVAGVAYDAVPQQPLS